MHSSSRNPHSGSESSENNQRSHCELNYCLLHKQRFGPPVRRLCSLALASPAGRGGGGAPPTVVGRSKHSLSQTPLRWAPSATAPLSPPHHHRPPGAQIPSGPRYIGAAGRRRKARHHPQSPVKKGTRRVPIPLSQSPLRRGPQEEHGNSTPGRCQEAPGPRRPSQTRPCGRQTTTLTRLQEEEGNIRAPPAQGIPMHRGKMHRCMAGPARNTQTSRGLAWSLGTPPLPRHRRPWEASPPPPHGGPEASAIPVPLRYARRCTRQVVHREEAPVALSGVPFTHKALPPQKASAGGGGTIHPPRPMVVAVSQREGGSDSPPVPTTPPPHVVGPGHNSHF